MFSLEQIAYYMVVNCPAARIIVHPLVKTGQSAPKGVP